MKIVEYDEKYKEQFIEFNTDWIVDNFGFLEKEDIDTFEQIESLLESGAMIYFAVEGDTVLATCMAIPGADKTWEICKLASNKSVSHKGAGSAVFKAVMDFAIGHGAKKLFLLSNSKLKPAVRIYEKFGFKEVKLDDYEYERGDIAFEYVVRR